MGLAFAIVAGIGAAGCFLSKEQEEAETSPNEVVGKGSTAAVLKSTLFLDAGCTAAKVGPKHLLVAARCVVGNPAFEAGKTLRFTVAAGGDNTIALEHAEGDAGAKTDGGAPDARTATIAEIDVPASWAAKCKEGGCGLQSLAASDAPDVAVVVLDEELATVPSVPVDLDPVGQGDPLLVASTGCATFDARTPGAPSLTRSVAAPPKMVNHDGSAYATSPQLVTRLGASYVITPGAAWRTSAPKVCATDIGAPLFRAGVAAVAGVMSGFTTFEPGKLVPVTIEHTRLDAQSRFKIGAWLASLGVETIHSCSESAGGCAKHEFEGGAPEAPQAGPTGPDDAGAEPDAAPGGDDGGSDGHDAAAEDPPGQTDRPLPPEEPSAGDDGSDEEPDYSDAAVAPKKKKTEKSGCSAAPGELPSGDLAFGLGVAAAALIARRRRR